MAHFAELDSNNKVLRVVVACDQDVADNGGDASASAAAHFETVNPLSENGVKWMQTSQDGSFRKRMAGTGNMYDEENDRFIVADAPYPSWTMNIDGDWICPIPYPTSFKDSSDEIIIMDWNEDNQKWIGFSYDPDTLTKLNWDWNSSSLVWDSV
tara:strand:- start:679 stop:1140 length:462 start_codon:yes stop_codon:yes gene_type:complete